MNNAGVLQFSLGLTTGGFLGALEKVRSGVGGMTGSLLSLPGLGTALGGTIASVGSLHAVVEGVFGAIERGSALEHLSARTQTSVANLFEMQKGFKAVGLESDSVGPMIFKLQKSLGGLNEFGVDTKSVFAHIGLSIADLKKMDAPAQFEAIGKALSKLDTSSAANAASTIFGREGAANMLQLAHSTGDYGAAIRKAAHDGELYEKNAASFAKIERGLDSIKGKTGTLFAGIAEGAAPGIQTMIDKLNTVDLGPVGQRIGDEISMAIKSIDLGKFGDYWTLTLQSGVQAMSNSMMEKISEWYAAMHGDSKDKDGHGFWSKMEAGTVGVGQGLLGGIHSILGMVSQKQNDWAVKSFQMAQENFDYAGIGDGILVHLADAVDRGMKGLPNEYADKLRIMRDGLSSAVMFDQEKFNFNRSIPGQAGSSIQSGKQGSKPDATPWEKLGLIIGGGNESAGRMEQHMSATAKNTADGVVQLNFANRLITELTGKVSMLQLVNQ